MIRFFIALLSVCLVIAGLVILTKYQYSPALQLPSFLYETLIFLTVCTGIIYRYLYQIQKPGFFVQLYLLTMAVKLLAYGGYTYYMIVNDKAGATLNVIFFMIIYFIFTGLEVTFLYRKIASKRDQ